MDIQTGNPSSQSSSNWGPEHASSARPRSKEQLRFLSGEGKAYAIFLLGPEGTVTTWNEGAERLSGYAEKDVLGTHFSVFYPPEDVEADVPEKALEAAAREGQWADEGWRMRKDGTRYWARVTITALPGEENEPRGFANVTCDLTGQKEQEEALRKSKRHYRRLFETAQEGITITTPSGEILDANPALCGLTGYDRQELLGRQASSLYDKASRERLVRGLQEQGRVFGLEMPLRRKDGEELICQVTATLWKDEDGQTQAIQSFVRDVTEEKRAQQALKESEAKFRALAENSTVGTLLIQDGRLQYVNEALAQMYGYAPEELIGREYTETLVHPNDRGRIQESIERRLHDDHEESTEARFQGVTKEGKTIYVEAYGTRIDYRGSPAIIGTDIDVTERMRLQREVLRVQEEERRRLGQDLHDVIASQLTGVSIMLDGLARREADDERLAGRIQEIRELVAESCEDIRQLSRGLTPAGLSEGNLPAALERLAENTDGGRLDADDLAAEDVDGGDFGDEELEEDFGPEDFEAALGADKAADEGSVAEKAKRFASGRGAGPGRSSGGSGLEGDTATHLYCIAQEATTNARKYAEADEIVIGLRREAGALLLTVEDDGKGFDPKAIKKEESLGLRTMRYRAELLGADFTVESSPGEGTLVRCRLPI